MNSVPGQGTEILQCCAMQLKKKVKNIFKVVHYLKNTMDINYPPFFSAVGYKSWPRDGPPNSGEDA